MIRRYSLLLPLALLAGCGDASQPVADGNSRTIACGPDGAPPALSCLLQVRDDRGTLHLTLRQPEGGFRRLLWPKGGELAAADGAEPLVAKRMARGGVEARIGGWVYFIEAKEGGLP